MIATTRHDVVSPAAASALSWWPLAASGSTAFVRLAGGSAGASSTGVPSVRTRFRLVAASRICCCCALMMLGAVFIRRLHVSSDQLDGSSIGQRRDATYCRHPGLTLQSLSSGRRRDVRVTKSHFLNLNVVSGTFMNIVQRWERCASKQASNAVLLFNARPGVSNHEIYGLIQLQKIRVIHHVCVRQCAVRGPPRKHENDPR